MDILQKKERIVIGYKSKVMQSNMRIAMNGAICLFHGVLCLTLVPLAMAEFRFDLKERVRKVRNASKDRKHYLFMCSKAMEEYERCKQHPELIQYAPIEN